MSGLLRDTRQIALSWRPLVFNFLPKLALLVIFLQQSNRGVLYRLDLYLERGELLGVALFLAIWVTALLAVVVVAFLPRLPWRIFWAVIICASAAAGKFYGQIMGSDLGVVEANLLWHARENAEDALVFYQDAFVAAVMATLPGLLAILWPVPRYGRALRTAVGQLYWTPLLPMVFFLAVHYGHKNALEGLPVQFGPAVVGGILLSNELASFEVSAKAASYVTLPQAKEPRSKHIVLVVDESIRGDYVDINVARGTTPFLLSQSGRIANFGIAASSANCSSYSNAILRYGPRRADLPDGLFRGATIWQHAQEAGYRTIFIDGQLTHGKLQNFMHASEMNSVDEIIQFDGVPKEQRDLKIADTIKSYLERPEPSFIYVNKAGVHFPYRRSHPAQEAVFLPQMAPDEPAGGERQKLVNSYKNGVRWAVDNFLRRLLQDLDLSDTVIIYTADHGQHLMEGEFAGTHCRTESPYVAEGIVPLFVMTEQPDLFAEFRKGAVRNHDKAGHFQIFSTVLGLLGFDRTAVRSERGPSLTDNIDETQAFAAGGILPGTGQKPNWIEISKSFLQEQQLSASRDTQLTF